MKRIAIFGSGAGTNAGSILKYFEESEVARVHLVLTNRKDAGIVDRARDYGVPVVIFNKEQLESGEVLERLDGHKIDFIALAGFLWKIPDHIIEEYEDLILNIHPALLPDYGGEGMYGMNVHRAVVENEEEETGISIHYVTEDYDDGEIVFQDTVEIDPDDSPEEVAGKVQELEHRHYPAVIEWVLTELEEEDE
jgi:phosphoribosylglycinamide formyltransferase-1